MSRACATLALALLAGCAAFDLSEPDCRGMNWHERGYADGFGGHPPQDYRLDAVCGRFGVAVDANRYLAGWSEGHDEWYRIMGSIGVD
jgi:Protein of unknown function (DUF2799)